MIITSTPIINGQAFIGGAYTAALSGKTFDCISPVDGRVLAQVAACDVADVDLAVRAAREAVDDGRWCNLAPAVRKRTLLRFAELIEQHAEELALLETLDMGKPIRDSRAVDVPATVNCFRWYAEAIDKVYGEVAPTASNVLATITREPLGVCGIVVPWNFPLIMAAWKLAPALAAGNSIILKPAEQSPLTAIRLAGLALEAGIPAGVFNVVPGFGETAGRAIGLHMDIDGVFFTGSTAVGKLFMQYSGQSNLKKVGLGMRWQNRAYHSGGLWRSGCGGGSGGLRHLFQPRGNVYRWITLDSGCADQGCGAGKAHRVCCHHATGQPA